MQTKHKIGVLTGGVIALLLGAGTATNDGLLGHWEGHDKTTNVAIHQAFDPSGVVTVCKGITNYDIPDLKEGDIYTRVMCHDAEAAALPKYNEMLASCLPDDFYVSDRQHAAMLSFVYNVGKHNFCESSVGREFRAGHRAQACRNMGKFVRANGVVLKGLNNRRYDQFWGEIAWCLRDD